MRDIEYAAYLLVLMNARRIIHGAKQNNPTIFTLDATLSRSKPLPVIMAAHQHPHQDSADPRSKEAKKKHPPHRHPKG
jgi:hypothetical protein